MFSSLFGKKESVNFKKLVESGAVIIDVRSKEEFAGGHIKGAKNIPLDTLGSLALDKEEQIITCCLSGGRSSMAEAMLKKAGYKNVHNGGGWASLQNKLQ